MKRKRSPADVRKAALTMLGPLMHLAAANWVKPDASGKPPPDAMVENAAALRQLADRFDALGARGSPSVLAEVWGDAELIR